MRLSDNGLLFICFFFKFEHRQQA